MGCGPALGGVLAWYSVIHIPDERVPEAFAEFCRVLAPGGLVLLAFQVGDEVVRVAEARGHQVALDYRWRRPERVAEWLDQAGLEVRAQLLREPDDDGDFPEQEPQAFLLARNPRNGADVSGFGTASARRLPGPTVPWTT